MAIKYSLMLPLGFVGELAGRQDPVEAFETLMAVGRTAEDAGYHCLWVPDHLMTAPPSQDYFFECWTTTAALLRETSRIRVGQLVTANGYRHPALQAKMAATVDVMGRGRFTFGIGAGWYEPDYASYGFEWLDGPARLRQLDEALQIIGSLLTKDETTFEGEFYSVANAILEPKGVQAPRIPMMVAGGGEKRTLKLVARHADLSNLIGDPTEVRRKFDILAEHCRTEGRDFAEIQRSVLMHVSVAATAEEAAAAVPPWVTGVFPGDFPSYGFVGTAETVRERIKVYEDAGAQEFVLTFADSTDLDTLRRFADEFIG
jgi:F420-dependent oxidoreductase-like protein